MIKYKAYKVIIITVAMLGVIGILPALSTLWNNINLSPITGPQAVANAFDIPGQATVIQVVPMAAFIQAADTSAGTDDANNWIFDFSDGSLSSDSATDKVCLVAPIDLPVDSTIDNFTVYIEDNFGSGDTTIYLDRTNFLGTWTELGQISSVNGGGIQALTDSTILAVDNANIVAVDYNYHISFCLPANSGGQIKLYGVLVTHSTLAAGPSDTVYLPTIFKDKTVLPPPTTLLITNLTGDSLTYTVFNTPEGNINCTILNNAVNETCGTFTQGTYNFKAVGWCGQKVGQRSYKPGNDALTPFRCN